MARTEGKEGEPVPFLFSYPVWVKVCAEDVNHRLVMNERQGISVKVEGADISLTLGAGRWVERDIHVYLSGV